MDSDINFSSICVVGLGYIGLPTAAMFASQKLQVIGVDINPNIVETINGGNIHITEPDLQESVGKSVASGYLTATTTPKPSDAFLIAVPTPVTGDNRDPDLSFVKAAASAIAPVLKAGNLVILESTSPVGTTEKLADIMAEERPDLSFPHQRGDASDIRLAYCPERVLPGKVMEELRSNDRVVGGLTSACSLAAAQLYRTFSAGECVIASNPSVAEMVKLAENSFRDVNIAFANELSVICDELNIDVWELIRLANRHPRVDILQPGPGVGGHCIAVDPWFIVASAGDKANLIKAARWVNDSKPDWVIDKVYAALGNHLALDPEASAENVVIAVYGLSFKPDVDDLRESPALEIAKTIAANHPGEVLAVEPNIEQISSLAGHGFSLVAFDDAMHRADIHVMLVDHSSFKKARPPHGQIVDTRGLWPQ